MAIKLVDLHIHTDNSPDGHHSPLSMCETAVSKGIRAVAFTDHYDITPDFNKFRYDKRAENAYFATEKARAAFSGKLLVIKGIELGEALHDVSKAAPILKRNYDMILGSVHNLKGEKDFKALEYEKIDIYEYLNRYFDELIELSKWDAVDVIAHLTCPLRYVYKNGKTADITVFNDKIDHILNNIIESQKALEVNTSELFGSLGKTMPDINIVKRYRQLGGKHITVGSDAHFSNDIGKGIEEAITMIKDCGFEGITVFVKREPIIVPF